MFRKPEIMSPAGHWPQLHAAIEAGADAVYFGLTHFTARAKVGFSLAELPSAIRTLHQRGVKGFITFNTLIFEDELAEAAERSPPSLIPAPTRLSSKTLPFLSWRVKLRRIWNCTPAHR